MLSKGDGYLKRLKVENGINGFAKGDLDTSGTHVFWVFVANSILLAVVVTEPLANDAIRTLAADVTSSHASSLKSREAFHPYAGGLTDTRRPPMSRVKKKGV